MPPAHTEYGATTAVARAAVRRRRVQGTASTAAAAGSSRTYAAPAASATSARRTYPNGGPSAASRPAPGNRVQRPTITPNSGPPTAAATAAPSLPARPAGLMAAESGKCDAAMARYIDATQTTATAPGTRQARHRAPVRVTPSAGAASTASVDGAIERVS